MGKISILHISDIHKEEGYDLNLLLQSMVREKKLWEQEGIKNPDYIVLSGDVIQGATTDEDIRAQYVEAEDFLAKLTDEILAGRRDRMIIVPGNHDINRHRTIKSVEGGDMESTAENIARYNLHSFRIRCDYKSLKLKQVMNDEMYDSRFELFVEFYNRFYQSVNRTYPKDPINEACIIPFEDVRICFVCFNSCNELDHLNIAGDISEDAIDSVAKDVRNLYNNGYLPIGVWHHNTYGDPYYTGYMRRGVLDDMQDMKIRIGLFGHQHYSQTAEDYCSQLHSEGDYANRMLVISSGTLYGAKKATANKCKRQFNIIVLDLCREDGVANMTINVREDQTDLEPEPFFAPQSDSPTLRFKVGFKKTDIFEIIREISVETIKTGDYVHAVERLQNECAGNKQAQSLILEYVKHLDSDEIVKCTPIPLSLAHCIQLMGAIKDTRDRRAFDNLSQNDTFLNEYMQDAFIKSEYDNMTKIFG